MKSTFFTLSIVKFIATCVALIPVISFAAPEGAVDQQAQYAANYPGAISPMEAKAKLDRGQAILIDVREEDEVSSGMAEPAHWYAKSAIDADEEAFVRFLGQFPGKEIIVYCRSGKRASMVIEKIAQRDISAKNMGGFSDWVAAGYPVKSPASAQR